MFPIKYPVPQTNPPLSPRETLPTMYDLPSENPEEAGLPDEFHGLQAQILMILFHPPLYPASQVFSAGDMNIYYDVRHPLWYKKPDWFGVVGVPRLYDEVDTRMSYVVWQERVDPFIVVELLSPGTKKEDLGETDEEKLPSTSPQIAGNGQGITLASDKKPPRKWEVYEQILRVPYYVVFNRYNNQLRVFKLEGGRYQELELAESRVWMEELGLGLGLWEGEYLGVNRLWLRWYDEEGNWILSDAEVERLRAEEAESRAEEAESRAEEAESKLVSLIQRLRESGINPDAFLHGED